MPKSDFTLNPPLINAAGSLGFAPDLYGLVNLQRLGAFVTNPISLELRRPATNAVCIPYPGGFLLHTGYPNPGLRTGVRTYASAWSRSPLPVVVALLPQRIEDAPLMLEKLEGLPGVMGIEINPPPQMEARYLLEMVRGVFGELAVVVRLPLDRALELVKDRAGDLLEAGLAAVSLGPPRGALATPEGKLLSGRLFGPSLFPQTLAVTQALVQTGLPVVAGSGVYNRSQAHSLMEAGALAVQLDAVLWKDPLLSGW